MNLYFFFLTFALLLVPSWCQYQLVANISLSTIAIKTTISNAHTTYALTSTELSSARPLIPISTVEASSLVADASPITSADPASVTAESSAIDVIASDLITQSGVITGTNWLKPSPPPVNTFSTKTFAPITATVAGKPIDVVLADVQIPVPSSAAQISDTQAVDDQLSLLEALERNPDTTAFAAMLRQNPGVLKMLRNDTTYDVFAPSNEAFAALGNPSQRKRDDDGASAQACGQMSGNRGDTAPPLEEVPQTLDTLLSTPWVNMGPGKPFQVVSQPVDSPGYRRLLARDNSSNITIISGLGAQSKIFADQIKYTGGTIHVSDSFFTRPKSLSDTLDIKGFKNLKTSLKKAGLLDGLSNTPGVTMFIPKEDFASGDLSTLVLNHHILPNMFKHTPELHDGDTYTSAANDQIKITNSGGKLYVNDAAIMEGNIIMTNGVLHIVDKVVGPVSSAPQSSSSGGSGNGSETGGGSSSSQKSDSRVLKPSKVFFYSMGFAYVFGAALNCWF